MVRTKGSAETVKRRAKINVLSRAGWRGLRTKIIAWSFVPTAIILLAVALIAFFAFQRVTGALVLQRDLAITDAAAGQLATSLEGYADRLTALARTADIYGNDPAAQRDALALFKNRLAIFDGGVLILDTFGKVVAAEPGRPEILGQDWSDRTYYQEIVRSELAGAPSELVASDIVADGPGGAEVTVMAVPITGERGEFLGILAGMFRLGTTAVSTFYGDLVKLRVVEEESDSVYLVDGQGRVLYHPSASLMGQDLSAHPVVPRVLDGETGAVRTRDASGRDIVAGFAPVPGTTWGLITEQSWATLTRDSRGYRNYLLLLLALGVVVPAVVVAVGVRRITRPITELIGAAQKVARGEFSQTIVARTGDEIEELAAQFNLMAAQLKESYASLEQRVAERTSELAARNRELTLLNRVIAATTTETDSRAVLHTVCRELSLAFHVPETGAALLDAGGTVLNVIAEYRSEGRPSALGVDLPVKGYPSAEYVLEHKAPLAIADAQHDPLMASVHDLMRERGAVSLLILPLTVRGEVVGTIGLVSTVRREYSADEIALGMNVAAAAAQALDGAWTRQRLVESQRRLSTLMDNLPGMVYRCDDDQDWTMEFVSDGSLELTGYRPSDLIDNNKISYAQVIHPEDRERVWQTVQTALEDGVPFEIVYRIVTADGQEKWVWEQGRGTFSPEGELLALEGFITDITALTEAEEARRRSEQMLSLHIQQTPLAYIEWNTDLEVMDWNPSAERIFGYSKHETVGRHAYELIVAPEAQPQVTEVWQNILNQTGGARSTNENRTKDGRTIVCEWYNTPLVNSEGQVIGLASLAQDVTARVEVEKELRQTKDAAIEAQRAAEAANRAKSVFLANMSHELRTPLNAILGFSQLMVRDPSLADKQKESLEVIARSGEHLLTLINDVLEMSKIEAGRTTIDKNSFDLHRMLDDLDDMFYLRAVDKGIALVVEYGADVPQYVHTDESKLRQVLINLLSNAIKFTAEGSVTVRARCRGTEVSSEGEDGQAASPAARCVLDFEVEDTGVGIAAEDLGGLFDPFVQTASGLAAQEGTGLGLPISRQFVQLMGGNIAVESVLGSGSTFRFDIQVELAEASEVQVAQPARQVIGLEPGQPGYRLLVAEDRESNRKLLVRLLTDLCVLPTGAVASTSQAGFEVREAVNGQEALQIWEEWNPHLIWMDMRMPVINGHEAVKRIKATTQGQATIIIALTASAFEEDRQIILSEGCDDFVRKPFHEAEIFEKLTTHLGVRFIYEQVEPSSQAPSPGTREDIIAASKECLTREALTALPAGWVDKLSQAAQRADRDLVLDLVEQIRVEHAPVADALANLVHNYRFDVIVKMAQEPGG
jgi:PAS domain S-box-containing protein